MTTSESRARAAFIGSSISWLGPGVWQQHYPLAGGGWETSVDWPLTVLPGICGSGRCRLDRRQFPPNVHVGLSTAEVRCERTPDERCVWSEKSKHRINVRPARVSICIRIWLTYGTPRMHVHMKLSSRGKLQCRRRGLLSSCGTSGQLGSDRGRPAGWGAAVPLGGPGSSRRARHQQAPSFGAVPVLCLRSAGHSCRR